MISAVLMLQKASNSVPFLKFDDLTVGSRYEIDHFALVDTQYGRRVSVWINEDILHLPIRFVKEISTQEQIDALNENKYVMIYGGKDLNRKNRILIDFETVEI